MSSTSAPVSTATTPGMASAADVSMDTIRACAIGLRSDLAVEHPGHAHVAHVLRVARAASRPRPRGGIDRPDLGAPIDVAGLGARAPRCVIASAGPCPRARGPRRGCPGSRCSGTGCPARPCRIERLVRQLAGLQQGVDGQRHGRRAEPALDGRVAREGIRDGREGRQLPKALDGQDLAAPSVSAAR